MFLLIKIYFNLKKDALLENLTAKEHLELYATIKGIPKNLIPELVQKKI